MGRENREMLENFAGSFRPSLGCKFGSQKRKKKRGAWWRKDVGRVLISLYSQVHFNRDGSLIVSSSYDGLW